MDLKSTLEKLTAFAVELGEWQLERHGDEALEIDTKSSSVDFVTEMDKKSEEKIIAFIHGLYPDHGIYGEETGESEHDSDYLWIIDPIDGTTNYKHGYPIFSISIALNYKDEAVLGLVHVPMLKQTYSAIRDGGAFCNGRPISVSTTETLAKSVLGTGFPYTKATDPNNNVDEFSTLLPKISGVRRSGSAAFDLVQVAAGHTDGQWELKLNAYDMAAGNLIIEEAGGAVAVFPEGSAFNIIATNGRIQKELTEVLLSVNPSNFSL